MPRAEGSLEWDLVAPRSIAELLPRPFDELDVADVEQMVSGPFEERESLLLELKERLSRDSVAKTCAAFANTMGGLLIGGVPDDSHQLVGLDDQVGDAQLWVKDILRERVIPLPPFRARRLDLADGRWLMLVLVEESSTTPHLLAKQGAIYVRNPGSSDPRPLGDQGRLLDLLSRGEQTRTLALSRAREAAQSRIELPEYLEGPRRTLSVAFASTGVSEWFEDRLLRDPDGFDRLAAVLPEDDAHPDTRAVEEMWHQHSVVAFRVYPRHRNLRPDRVEIVRAHRDGVVLLRSGFVGRVDEMFESFVTRDELSAWLGSKLAVGRDLLLELGAHGDVRVVVRLEAPRRIQWTPVTHADLDADIAVETWTALDLDEPRATALVSRIEAEIGRAIGVGPHRPN